MDNERPTLYVQLLLGLALLAVIAGAVLRGPSADWDLAVLGILLAFSALSDVMSIETESRLKISGNFLALVLAMVLLGGAPAALIGAISILVGWLRFREPFDDLLVNALTYVSFPLLVGIGFHELMAATKAPKTKT